MRRALAGAVVVLPLLAGCGGDQQDAYCGAVKEHQEELSDLVGSGEPDALLRALSVFRDLQAEAPDDISDEWQQVVGRIAELDEALDDAEVDASTYDRDRPPPGLTSEQKARIDAAAKELGSGTTLRALQDLDLHARDVCHTALTL